MWFGTDAILVCVLEMTPVATYISMVPAQMWFWTKWYQLKCGSELKRIWKLWLINVCLGVVCVCFCVAREVVGGNKKETCQTFTIHQLQYFKQLYNSFERPVQFNLDCFSTRVSPSDFKGAGLLSHGMVRAIILPGDEANACQWRQAVGLPAFRRRSTWPMLAIEIVNNFCAPTFYSRSSKPVLIHRIWVLFRRAFTREGMYSSWFSVCLVEFVDTWVM